MKDRNNTLAFLVVLSLLLGPMCAKSNDEKIISFAIPISDNLMSVLGDKTDTRKRPLSEMLESIGIVFYPGSEVSLDKQEGKICGKLEHSEAQLVVALSQMLSDSTVEEIRLYFNPPSECFPPKAAPQGATGQPATTPPVGD
jgi:hypothetical protein